jgi:hypothetical protein
VPRYNPKWRFLKNWYNILLTQHNNKHITFEYKIHTRSTCKIMEDPKMAALLSSTTPDTDTSVHPTNAIHETDKSISIKDTTPTNIKISSTHPRFSTLDIIQNFPHIQHDCFYHKIKVSIPWKNADSIPNEDTYCPTP